MFAVSRRMKSATFLGNVEVVIDRGELFLVIVVSVLDAVLLRLEAISRQLGL